jgi:hypothetical protein
MIETFFLTVKKGKYMRSTVLPGIFLASILILSNVLPGYAAEGKPEVVVSAAKSLKERGLDGKDKVPAELDGKGIKTKSKFDAREGSKENAPEAGTTQDITIKTKSSNVKEPRPGASSRYSNEQSASNVPTTSAEIAKLISKLKDELKSNPKALGLLNALEAQIKILLYSVSEREGKPTNMTAFPSVWPAPAKVKISDSEPADKANKPNKKIAVSEPGAPVDKNKK